MSIINNLRRIAANRRTNNVFNELTKDINKSNIQANTLNRQTIHKIDELLKKVNSIPLNNEKLVFDNNIIGTYQQKFIKEKLSKSFLIHIIIEDLSSRN
jgi:hypothetical protein